MYTCSLNQHRSSRACFHLPPSLGLSISFLSHHSCHHVGMFTFTKLGRGPIPCIHPRRMASVAASSLPPSHPQLQWILRRHEVCMRAGAARLISADRGEREGECGGWVWWGCPAGDRETLYGGLTGQLGRQKTSHVRPQQDTPRCSGGP